MSITRNFLLYLVYFVLVLALGLTIILSFTHHAKKSPVVKAPGSSHKLNTQSDKAPTANSSPANPPSDSSATTAAGDSAKTAIAAANNPTTLTNTGPGSTAALFVGTSLIGSFVYRRRLLSRLV